MVKPVILIVDDDPAVLSAVERDLRKKFGGQFRFLRSDSGRAALQALDRVKLRNEPVALFLVDQRMPEMTGVEFLQQAIKLFPQAKRVLLTAYADTDAAIRAINESRLDQYLMKPWDPPEEKLYPVIQDLIDDWLAAFRPPFEGIRIVGHRWSPASHQVKDFLARNQIPYQFMDVESDAEARRLVEAAGQEPSLAPLVIFPDGSHLVGPTNIQLAEKVGLKTHAQVKFYDLLIVGGGPAGLAAAVYGASEGLHTLLIEQEAPGGQAGTSSRIENYLGFPVGLSGADLARRGVAQAARFGAEILTPQEACSLRTNDRYRTVVLQDGSEITCHALLIATGVAYRKLEVPGAEALAGAGVYYGAAMTEAISCAEQDIYVVGGGNSAGQAAMYLSGYARNVRMLIRGDSLAQTMSQYLVEQLKATPNVSVETYASVTELHGDTCLSSLTVKDLKTGEAKTVPANALFIFIGAAPRTDWLGETVERDADGFIFTGPDLPRVGRYPRGWPLDREPFWLETSVPGVMVAGDVRHGSVKRIVSAVGEGGMAIQFVHRYLASL